MDLKITQKEREYLRDLAKRQAEIAALPVMKQRTEEWYAHNALRGKRPMVIIETTSFCPYHSISSLPSATISGRTVISTG